MLQRGDEFVAHGRSNSERQGDMWEQDEARLIAETTEAIRKFTGKKPAGWMSPWLSQSRQTLDLLQEAGYLYQCDWPLDDQPIWMRTRGGKILNMPYPVETNDSPMMLMRLHTAAELSTIWIDQFDEMLDQSRKGQVAGLPVRAAHLHPRPAIPPAAAQACHAAYPESPRRDLVDPARRDRGARREAASRHSAGLLTVRGGRLGPMSTGPTGQIHQGRILMYRRHIGWRIFTAEQTSAAKKSTLASLTADVPLKTIATSPFASRARGPRHRTRYDRISG